MGLPASLDEWLDYIAHQHAKGIELGLERVAGVYRRLGIERAALGRVITVAGTNGKGSTQAALDALLRAQGFRVGCYSSPHLLRYNERVRIQGREADDELLCRSFARVEAARGDTPLTYFEFGTLSALLCLSEAELDFCILEIGLGGRLDAVNLVDADLALITTVDIDHVDWLGPDRESIGREKAGILRAGIRFVCGDPEPPVSVREAAERLGCQSRWRGQDFAVETQGQGGWHWWGHDAQGLRLERKGLPPARLPVDNLAAAMQALALLDQLPDTATLARVLADLEMPGRFQRLPGSPEVVLDVGHNPHAARYLRRRVQDIGGQWLAVFSALGDKDVAQVIAALADVVGQWYCAPLAVERAASREQLQAAFDAVGVQRVRWFDSLGEAFDQARAEATQGERILAFGSFHVVADILGHLEPCP